MMAFKTFIFEILESHAFKKIQHMLGPFTFTFTFTLESEEFEKSEKVGAADFYQTMITTRAPDGANKVWPIDQMMGASFPISLRAKLTE